MDIFQYDFIAWGIRPRSFILYVLLQVRNTNIYCERSPSKELILAIWRLHISGAVSASRPVIVVGWMGEGAWEGG